MFGKGADHPTRRSEGFPARDIWFLGTLDQGSARCPELLGRRRRHLILRGEAAAPPDTPFKTARRPPGFTGWLAGLLVGWLACWLVYVLSCWMARLMSGLPGLLVGWLAC